MSERESDGEEDHEKEIAGGDDETRTVTIPPDLARRIETRIAGREFEDVDEYVATALALLLREVEREGSPGDGPRNGGLESAAADEDEVRDRLDSLGYL